MERKSMGSFIAALRKANGLTQKDLAEKLNVSDKSVSRWERDDGAPDLSLIPVIAEIFGITSDELLCGQRRAASTQACADGKAEKQRLRLLSASLLRHKNMSFAAGGLAVCGLLAALIGNIAFLRAYIGFFAGAVLFLAAVVVELICTNCAFAAVRDEQGDGEVGLFQYSVLVRAETVISFSVTLFCATIPLVVFVNDAYAGLSMAFLWRYGLPFGAAALAVCGIVCFVLNHSLLKQGVYTLDETHAAAYRHNYERKRRCGLVLAAVLGVTVFLHGLLTAWGYTPALATGTTFDDLDSFRAYMEQDIPYEGVGDVPPEPVGHTPVTYYDEDGNVVSEEAALTRTITDANGTVLCSFVHRNNAVYSWRHAVLAGDGAAEVLPITVYTYDDIRVAQEKAAGVNAVFSVLYWVELAAAVGVYYRRRMRV